MGDLLDIEEEARVALDVTGGLTVRELLRGVYGPLCSACKACGQRIEENMPVTCDFSSKVRCRGVKPALKVAVMVVCCGKAGNIRRILTQGLQSRGVSVLFHRLLCLSVSCADCRFERSCLLTGKR